MFTGNDGDNMPGTDLLHYKECACCKEQFPISDMKQWRWRMDKDFFCSYSCYSKVYDKMYVGSRVSSRVSRPSAMPVELERAIRSGRR